MEKISTKKIKGIIARNCQKHGLRWRRIVREGKEIKVALEQPDGGTTWVHFTPRSGQKRYGMQISMTL